MKYLIALLLGTVAFGQSLSLSCPPPQKFNQPAICTLSYSGTAISSMQWVFSSSPIINLSVQSLASGKSITTANGIYMLIGNNATPVSGQVAAITIPAHSGTVTLNIKSPLGSSVNGAHAVPISPGISVSVQ